MFNKLGRNIFIFLWLFMYVLCVPVAYSSQVPVSLSTDKRIKHVVYAPNDVVLLTGDTFINSQIIFGIKESVIDIQCGDSAAWSVSVNKTLPYIVNIKPMIGLSDTDLMITTIDSSRKTKNYTFHLKSVDGSSKDQVTFAVKFSYDEVVKPVSHDLLEATDVSSAGSRHWDYSFNGCKHIVPVHVFDNGKFTYFQFRHDQVIPAIFSINNAKAKESLINFRRDGDYIVVLGVYPQYSLRADANCVASIFNKRIIHER